MAYRQTKKNGTDKTDKKADKTISGKSSGKTTGKTEPISVSLAASDAVQDWKKLRAAEKKKRNAQREAKIAARGGVAVGSLSHEIAPLWTVRFRERHGSLLGRFLYGILLFVVIPTSVPVGWFAMRFLASTVVGETFPRQVLDDAGMPGQVMLGSPDNFMLRWITPVNFMVLVLAIVTGWCIITGVKWVARWMLRLRAGLYAGYEQTTWENMKERRITRQMRATERKAHRAARRAEKEANRAAVTTAQETDSRL